MDKKEQIKLANEQLIGQGNFGSRDSFFSPNYIAHSGAKDFKGRKFIKQFVGQLRKAIPDIRVIKVEFLNQTSNTIAWQQALSGTHKVKMKGIPASNRKAKWTEMVVTRFENGKIAEDWLISELAGELMIQYGRAKRIIILVKSFTIFQTIR